MLNEAQQLAITTRVANVLVSAGAGSGKTRVLTSRYLALLDNGKGRDRYQLDDILMLTFTRKAAQEMRERIAGELAKQGRMHERREISRAPIGTIHSFCESILREYALDAGIDPNFRLLDDAETHTLLENALDAVFEDLWAGTQQEREEIGKLVLEISQQTLRSALLAVYETSRTHGRSLQQQALIPNSDISAIASSLCRAIDDLLSQQGGTAKWKSNLEQVEAAYQELRPYLQ
ncbi:MAG TPA: UvrD-helicase domain-containing protein, partial [Armatimonadota bacterium]|nr:UvrD-helicase domain-containing protein [Armatimonadota bacterium]